MVIPESAWKAEQAAHEAGLGPFVQAHLDRKSRGDEHPVHDFLFSYYSFRPSQLMRWHPEPGALLAGDTRCFARYAAYRDFPDGLGRDPARFPAHRIRALRWVLEHLRRTRSRPPMLGCFGLHEWAMVYRSEQPRHARPLRLPPDELAAFVEGQPLCCTHYDAFRFFTPPARGLNQLDLDPDTRSEHEQPGCLHANMDLYKWAHKFDPWPGSRLLRACFEFAQDARELDMRASPYDLSDLGYEALCIETEEGRAGYRAEQAALAERAAPLREALIACYEALLNEVERAVAPGALSG